jgi:hypothetical protein
MFLDPCDRLLLTVNFKLTRCFTSEWFGAERKKKDLTLNWGSKVSSSRLSRTGLMCFKLIDRNKSLIGPEIHWNTQSSTEYSDNFCDPIAYGECSDL